ncbi:MAG: penicillin-binding protein 1A [bacterium]
MFRRRRRRLSQRYAPAKPPSALRRRLKSGLGFGLKSPNFLTKLIILSGLFAFLAFIGATTGIIIGFSSSMPDLGPILETEGMEYWELPTKVFSQDDKLIGVFSVGRREMIKLHEVPKNLIDAVIATEDVTFNKHRGINPKGMLRAFVVNLISRKISQGGSTITQQLVKNLFLTQERTYRRKIQEIILALMVEKKLTKDEIMERYLNKIYLGHGNYGVESAALFYFDKHVTDLSLAQCAMIAGLPGSPSHFSPISHPDAAAERQALVLKRMEKVGIITPEQTTAAKEEFCGQLSMMSKKAFAKTCTTINVSPYFTEYIRRMLSAAYGDNAIYKGGLKVYTTMDIAMQKAAEDVLSKALNDLNKRRSNKASRIEGALVAIEPSTGYIKAMVGGSGFSKYNQVNRVIQAHRQPGSSFKPFIYTAAIDSGLTPCSLLEDSPVKYIGTDGKEWEPQNYENKFEGTVTLREALEKSINVASIKLLEKVTPRKVVSYAHRMGIKSYINHDLSIALGTAEVTPLEIATAYIPFANQGIKTKPIAIKCIKDKKDAAIKESMPQEERVISPQTAYIITSLLKGVVERGTAREAIGNRLGREVAGKTGTTNDYVDAWFIGYTTQLVVCVWVGYDKGQITMGHGMAGGVVAAPIWRDFMMKIINKMPPASFPKPEGIITACIDPSCGLLATQNCPQMRNEYFIKGTEPIKYCTTHAGLLPQGEQEQNVTEPEPKEEPVEEDVDKVMLEE